jgi:hypothetical protein
MYRQDHHREPGGTDPVAFEEGRIPSYMPARYRGKRGSQLATYQDFINYHMDDHKRTSYYAGRDRLARITGKREV